ncbi:hypothetical protein MANES_09G081676v8 [Manihot esculenta]|uniref:Uncharacterized protein n=1 Tax=Manihot esculenta TaxID=3983 RepID=A0ACB7H5M8_MANES|nr:hypothetical protein MANES_09G081676v8 [Manihot esculenta]
MAPHVQDFVEFALILKMMVKPSPYQKLPYVVPLISLFHNLGFDIENEKHKTNLIAIRELQSDDDRRKNKLEKGKGKIDTSETQVHLSRGKRNMKELKGIKEISYSNVNSVEVFMETQKAFMVKLEGKIDLVFSKLEYF